MAKFFILTAIFCIISATLSKAEFNKEEAIKHFIAKMDSCKGEVGASDKDVDDLVNQVAASSKEGKCLRACLMKGFGVMDDSGKFVKAVAMKHAGDYTDGNADKMKTATEMVDACSSISVSDDHCEAAEAYGTCFVGQAKSHGLEKFKFEKL